MDLARHYPILLNLQVSCIQTKNTLLCLVTDIIVYKCSFAICQSMSRHMSFSVKKIRFFVYDLWLSTNMIVARIWSSTPELDRTSDTNSFWTSCTTILRYLICNHEEVFVFIHSLTKFLNWIEVNFNGTPSNILYLFIKRT